MGGAREDSSGGVLSNRGAQCSEEQNDQEQANDLIDVRTSSLSVCGVEFGDERLEGRSRRFIWGGTFQSRGAVFWMSLSVVGSGKVVLRLGPGAVHLALALVLSTADGLLSQTGAPCRMA